jgi:hypothetical protein
MPEHPAITAAVEYKSVTVRLTNSDGKPFWAHISENGIEFYSRQSSPGVLADNPIAKSGAEIFDWIANEGLGKEFAERVVFNRKPPSPASSDRLSLKLPFRNNSRPDERK